MIQGESKMNNVLKKRLSCILIILFVVTGLSPLVQGDVVMDTYTREIVSESSNTNLVHVFCGKIHNLTNFGNFSVIMFYSDNMRELLYAKGSDGSWMMWYSRSRSEAWYWLSASDFRGILTQRFIVGYTIEYDE